MDDVFEEVCNLPDVAHLMQPLPKASGSGKHGPTATTMTSTPDWVTPLPGSPKPKLQQQ